MRKAANKASNGIEQRDAAVRAGANGAVTLAFKDGHLRMPPGGDSKIRDSAGVIKQMVGNSRPDEDDVIVIAGADTGRLAEDPARTAAWTLLK
jgi:hypothetical protein